jgi:GNAT acetyltransferase-like protein
LVTGSASQPGAKGHATGGSRALICKGFTEFGVQRVVAEAMAVNVASRRVMEKAGLKLARTFHQPWPYPIEGDQFGDVEYALDRAGWQQDQVGGPGYPPALAATTGPFAPRRVVASRPVRESAR